MQMYPLKFKPIFKQRIWGGQKLREVFGKDLTLGAKIGESWELADLPEDKSVIINGELSGTPINKALIKYPEEITGDAGFEYHFPLLIKILDAQDVLSVQVHPDEQTCDEMGKGDPKTECWYIIDAEPDAVIYKGLKEGVTKEQFREAIVSGTTATLLNKIEVRPGECHFLPAGTLHAIGAGLLIAEIQLPSDTTYRVFDWNRVDENGRGRELHLDESMESINFDQDASKLKATTTGRLVDCEYFTVDKGHQTAGCEKLLQRGQMQVVMIISGNGEFIKEGQNNVSFSSGDTILIPAAYQGVMVFREETKYLAIQTTDYYV